MDLDREALLKVFLAECEELLAGMEESLLALESRPEDAETLPAIFRIAHTLKGNAVALGFSAMAELAHALEDLLERLGKVRTPLSRAQIGLLLRTVDVLRERVSEAAEGIDSSSPAQALLEQLREAASLASATEEAAVGTEPAPRLGGTEPGALRGGRAHTLRVDVEKLDRMLSLTGEIAVARGRLAQMLAGLVGGRGEEVREAHREADRLQLELQEQVMKVRMVPVGPAFRHHVRTVRDLAAAHGKRARLLLEGEEVEVDTSVIEQLRDPLTHMIRNAVDHGIEPPAEREARGKEPCGRLTLRAAHETGSIVIQLADDGAGLDRARIAEKARQLGLASDPERLSDQEVFRLVLQPGLTTAEAVTDLSGRGVGMDIVRRSVEALRGSLALDSRRGEGTTVTLRLPLTLAIIDGFTVGVESETYVIPLDVVTECLELPREQDDGGGRSGVLSLRGEALPYVRLRAVFGREGPSSGREHVVVVRHGEGRAGIVVDALHGEGETVIKPLGPLFKDLPGVAGSSVVGDGRVALILDTSAILREFTRSGPPNGLQGVES